MINSWFVRQHDGSPRHSYANLMRIRPGGCYVDLVRSRRMPFVTHHRRGSCGSHDGQRIERPRCGCGASSARGYGPTRYLNRAPSSPPRCATPSGQINQRRPSRHAFQWGAARSSPGARGRDTGPTIDRAWPECDIPAIAPIRADHDQCRRRTDRSTSAGRDAFRGARFPGSLGAGAAGTLSQCSPRSAVNRC